MRARPPTVTSRPAHRAALAIALAGWGLVAAPGCLVPMPIEGEEVEVNYPPFYFFGQIRPAFTRTVTYDPELDPESEGIEFSTGPLGDPNDEDRLFWRWFFNYGVGSTAIEAASPINGLAPEQRGQGVALQVRPCEDLRRRFPEVQIHRIELVLADRPFAADDGQGPRNQGLPDGSGQVRLVWYLEFDPSRCPL